MHLINVVLFRIFGLRRRTWLAAVAVVIGLDIRLSTEKKSDGYFEFVGLALGSYSMFPSVKGYSLAPVSAKRARPDGTTENVTYVPTVVEPFSIDRDVDDYVITPSPE